MKHIFRSMSFINGRRDLVLVVAARTVSMFGDLVATIALVLRLQAHGAGAAAVAALLIANLAPIVLLSGVVGRLVDSRDNRALLIMSGLAQAAVCAPLAAVGSLPLTLVLVTLLGVGQAVNGATWQALLPALVPADRLPRAISFSQAATTLAGIVAPAAGGVLVGLYGTAVPLLVDSGSFLAIATAAVLVRTRRVLAVPDGTRPAGGLAIVRRDPVLRATIALLGLFILLGATVNVVEVFLVRVTLHADALWYGLTAAGYAAGVFVGAVATGRIPAGRTQARWFVGSAAALAVGLVGMGLAPTVEALLIVGFATGIGNGVLSVCAQGLLLGAAAPAERGRVGALVTGVLSAAELGAYAGGGAIAIVLGPREIFVGAGVLGVLAPLLLGRVLLRAVRATPGGDETVRRSSRAAGASGAPAAPASGTRDPAPSRG
jgi:MFS family permease